MFIRRDFGEELKPGTVLRVWVGATRQQHVGKGIATRLRTFMLDHARKTKCFPYAYVQITNTATRYIYILINLAEEY